MTTAASSAKASGVGLDACCFATWQGVPVLLLSARAGPTSTFFSSSPSCAISLA